MPTVPPDESPLKHEGTEENARLNAVIALDLLDKPEEERFLRITRLVRRHFQASASAITLLDEDRAFYLARDGLTERHNPRSHSLCAEVVQGKRPVVLADQSEDLRSPQYQALIDRLKLAFYAGFPILNPDGYAVGALCVMDHIPRRFSRRELESLADFAAIVEDEILVKRAAEENLELISQVEKLRLRAFVDPLTGVWNRGALFDLLSRERDRAQRGGQPLSVCMLDLDHFKRINDQFGHQTGDEVLRETCRRIRASVRPYDGLGRYGGEEFLLVFPETTLQQAVAQAERVREALASPPFSLGEDRSETVTASFGAAQLRDAEELDELLARADKALYRAKNRGRNQVVPSTTEDND